MVMNGVCLMWSYNWSEGVHCWEECLGVLDNYLPSLHSTWRLCAVAQVVTHSFYPSNVPHQTPDSALWESWRRGASGSWHPSTTVPYTIISQKHIWCTGLSQRCYHSALSRKIDDRPAPRAIINHVQAWTDTKSRFGWCAFLLAKYLVLSNIVQLVIRKKNMQHYRGNAAWTKCNVTALFGEVL